MLRSQLDFSVDSALTFQSWRFKSIQYKAHGVLNWSLKYLRTEPDIRVCRKPTGSFANDRRG